MFDVFVPTDDSTSQLQTRFHRVLNAEAVDGKRMFRGVMPAEFLDLVTNPKNGLAWSQANPDAMQKLAECNLRL